MYEQSCNFCLNTISNIIQETIEYYTTCKKKRITEENPNQPRAPPQSGEKNVFTEGFTKATNFFTLAIEKFTTTKPPNKNRIKKNKKLYSEEILFICPESIVFLGENVNNGIKRKLLFENILNITVKPGISSEIVINLKNPVKSQQKLQYTFLILNPGYFIENLNGKYQIYSVKTKGMKNNLDIKIDYMASLFTGILSSQAKGPNSIFMDDFDKKKSPNDEIYYVLNYKFYLNKKYKPNHHYTNIFANMEDYEIPKTKPNEQPALLSKIFIQILKENPIENLSENPSNKSLKVAARESVMNYLKGYLGENTKFWMKPMVKVNKPTLENDLSIWKGYKFELKTAPGKDGKGYNILYYYLRRLFIPPFFESYNDITIIFREDYYVYAKNRDFTPNTKEILSHLVNSLRPVQIQERNEVSDILVKTKLESYLIDGKTINFLYSRLNLVGNEGYKLVLDYKMKLALLYEKFEKEKISEDFRIVDEIVNTYLLLDNKEIDLDEYMKKLKYESFEDLVGKIEANINKYFGLTDKKTILLFKNKIANFIGNNLLSRVFAKGFFGRLLNLYKRLNDFAKALNPILNYMLNIQIITINYDIILNESISYIINNLGSIEQITYNENLMAYCISNGILRQIQSLESDLIYCQFLNYILNNNFSLKILRAVYIFLEKLKKALINKGQDEDEDLTSENSSTIKNLKLFIPTFVKLYSDPNNTLDINILSCKCLTILALIDYENRDLLSNEEFFGHIYHYFSSCEEEVIFYSIKLFGEILQTKCDMTKIIEENNGFLYKLINILKGHKMRGCYYHPELIHLVLSLLKKIILENSQIKILILKPENRKFVKYILKYIYDYNECLGEDELAYSYYFPIMTSVYNLLTEIIKKNSEIKKYIETNFHMIYLINQKSTQYMKIVDNSGDEKEQRDLIKKFLIALLKFMKSYISTDLLMVSITQYYGKNISLMLIKFGEFLSIDGEHRNENVMICKDLLMLLSGKDIINVD